MIRRVVVVGVLAALVVGCGGGGRSSVPSGPPVGLVPMSLTEIQQFRAERDEMFRRGADSPLPDAEKLRFGGVPYFPFDTKWQFVVRLERLPEPKPLRMITTTGEERPAVRLGFVTFDHAGERRRLAVYELRDQSVENWGVPFLPFKDATTGRETYAAGRYLDLQQGEGDWFVLDFNLAYHPACAYGRSGFQCPVTPEENRLPFPVDAGERLDPNRTETR